MTKETSRTERMEKIVSLCKRRGFIFQSSEIYGGWNGFWDYGPLGAELKRNLRQAWWKEIVQLRDDVVGLDASIIMHPAVWKASGHVDTFNDPMCACRACNKLTRADQAWSLLRETSWFTSLIKLLGTLPALPPVEKLTAWAAREGTRMAPNFFASKSPQSALEQLRLRLENNPQLTLEEAVQALATENPSLTGLSTPCPHCGGELSAPKPFNLMLKTHTGPIADDENLSYLRPETAQAIFAQFRNVYDSSRVKVPFGIAQIGKAFRNEITPRNFTFRSREFEQMELEFFILPDEAIELLHGNVEHWHEGADLSEPRPNWGWEMWHRYWLHQRLKFYQNIGLPPASLHCYWQKPEELAHYARATVDILFDFPFGTEELEGIAARGDFDLSQHQKHSGKKLEVFEETLKSAAASLTEQDRQAFLQKATASRQARGHSPEEARAWAENLTQGNFLPHVIEPSAGLDRLALAVLCAAYDEETITSQDGKTETRLVLRLHPRIAPVKLAVFPLLRNKPELVEEARRWEAIFKPFFNVAYDDSGAIGRRYRRQDEIGTPYCITIDFDTIGENGPENKGTVTLRNRDTMQQTRVTAEKLLPFLLEKVL